MKKTVLDTTVHSLSLALKERDIVTGLHSERVCELARLLAQELKITNKDFHVLKMGACFHDIGKIGIPDSILLKTSSLTEKEWEKMKTHTVIGQQIVNALGVEGCIEAGTIVRHHHEWFNGEGYPDQLVGKDIPLNSRIVSIVDAYDALVSHRTYHCSLTHEEAIETLKTETGTKFDPEIMKVFLSITKPS
jgi:HD-GYP domain-containing protein (c-di-GMP phosphodiesterase class II)